MMDFGLASLRWDGGMGDPNVMGAILAMGVAAVMPGVLRSGGMRGVAVGALFALIIVLALTQSRGGMVAAVAGCAAVIFSFARERRVCAETPARRGRRGLAAVLLCGMVAIFFFLGAPGRWANLSEDRSAGGRMEIWQAWPKALVAAPDGWGSANTEEAYHQWYQPLEYTERYRHLLSSHATWMAEMGWLGRWLYLFGWLAVFVLCGAKLTETDRLKGRPAHSESSPVAGNRSPILAWLFSAALGVWVAFAVAAIFSHVAQDWRVWMLPLAILLVVIFVRARFSWWPQIIAWEKCALAAGVLLVGLWTVGTLFPGEPRIRRLSNQALIVGAGEPSCWVLIDRASMGATYGRTLRGFYDAHASAGSSASIGLAGELAAVPEGATLCVFNPRSGPEEFVGREVRAWFGEFSQSPARTAWGNAENVCMIEGVGDFVPDWAEQIFGETSNFRSP